MNIPTIPEGKALVWVEAVYKEPIEGIPFSNEGMTIGMAVYVDKDNREQLRTELDTEIKVMTKEYFDKLATEIKSTRNTLIDQVRVELDEKYKGYIKELKEEIIKLKNNN